MASTKPPQQQQQEPQQKHHTPSQIRSGENSTRIHNCPYRCIECGHPARALVRRLGGDGSEIQRIPCSKCGAVDPYLEREFLLVVVLDVLLLLRRPALRHFLSNRYYCISEGAREERHEIHVSPLLVIVLIVGVRTHLALIASTERWPEHTDAEDLLPLARLWFHGAVGSALSVVLVPWLMLRLVAVGGPSDYHQPLAWLLIPTGLVYGMIDVVHLWENSALVRHVGSVWLLGHQFQLLLTLLQLQRDNGKRQQMPCVITAALVGLVTLLLRALVLALYWELFASSTPAQPCPGFYLSLPHDRRLCFV